MIVKVNDTELEIFDGARVMDAIRLYYTKNEIAIPDVLPEIRDAYGNIVADDGSLNSNSSLHIDIKNKKTSNNFLLKIKNIFCRKNANK